MSAINENHKMFVPDIWSTTDRIFSHFGALFALPTPPSDNLVNQNFEKMKKKTPGNFIILRKCTINDNHMVYSS